MNFIVLKEVCLGQKVPDTAANTQSYKILHYMAYLRQDIIVRTELQNTLQTK